MKNNRFKLISLAFALLLSSMFSLDAKKPGLYGKVGLPIHGYIAKLHFLIGVKSKGINGKWSFDNVFEQTQSQRIKFESKNEEENDNE